MKNIFNNWTIMRGIRLVLGIIVLVMAVTQKDVTLSVLAGVLLVTAIANVGCCGGSSCAVNYNSTKNKKEASI